MNRKMAIFLVVTGIMLLLFYVADWEANGFTWSRLFVMATIALAIAINFDNLRKETK